MRKQVLADAGLGDLGSALAQGDTFERVDTIAFRFLRSGWLVLAHQAGYDAVVTADPEPGYEQIVKECRFGLIALTTRLQTVRRMTSPTASPGSAFAPIRGC